MRAPEMQLTPEEARLYAESIAAVARHYDIGASAKALDWMNLATTMGSLYGVRIMAIKMRRGGGQDDPGVGHNGGPPLDGAGVAGIDLASLSATAGQA